MRDESTSTMLLKERVMKEAKRSLEEEDTQEDKANDRVLVAE